MLAAFIYLLLFLILILYNGFFKIFDDPFVSRKQFALLFLLKALAVPTMFLFYKIVYGGMEQFDSGIFYNDAKALHLFAYRYPTEYFKALFGFQDDAPGSFFFKECIVHTNNWDNGRIRVLFYNDNRIIIRLHSLLHFIAFNSYFVHALFSCFLSFIGITAMYKSFTSFFKGKGLWLLGVLCFFPSLWLHSGALLKEGWTLFFLGCSLLLIKKMIDGNLRPVNWILLFLLIFMSLLLKPYILFFGSMYFGLFFFIQKTTTKHKSLYFLASLVVLLLSFTLFSQLTQNKSIYEIAKARQRVFEDAAKGGIFLLDSVKFVRLNYDNSLVIPLNKQPGYFKIKAGVPYIYWEHNHQHDTLFCTANTDTLTHYQLVYQIAESGSNLTYEIASKSPAELLVQSLYYSMVHPLFFNTRSQLQMLASFENLLLLLSALLFFAGLFFSKQPVFPALALACFAFCIFILVGFTTPNSGAIFRYRSPGAVFLLLSALYYADLFLPKKATTST